MALETAKDGIERGFKRCVAFNDMINTPVYSHDCKGTDCGLSFAETACKNDCGSEITFHTHPVPSSGLSDQDLRQAKLNNKVGGCVAFADPFNLNLVTMKCVRGSDVDFQRLSEFHQVENDLFSSSDPTMRGEKLQGALDELLRDKEEAFKVCTMPFI